MPIFLNQRVMGKRARQPITYSIMLWEGHHGIAGVVADGLAVIAHFTSCRKTRNAVEYKVIYEDILEYLAKDLINKIVRDG